MESDSIISARTNLPERFSFEILYGGTNMQNQDFKEEVNEATVQFVGVVWDLQKPRISCQNLLPPKRRVAGRYGVKIETF